MLYQSYKRKNLKTILTMSLLLVFLIGGVIQAYGQEITPEIFNTLRYRHIGPPGNRTSAVCGEPGNPLVYYIGASSGGIWKSTDGANTWFPIFDDQPAQSIGALAIAPSDYNVVWAGTGEPFIRSNISIGNGVYKSTDAGKTWKHMGLEKTGRIGRVVIADCYPHLGTVQRGPERRDLEIHRWGRYLEPVDRARASLSSRRKDRHSHRPVQSSGGLCAHRNGHTQSRCPLALERWRRKLEAGQLQPPPERKITLCLPRHGQSS